jgi:NADH dehydrogenase/NADH:ubiquinone oxidoreductase subunit G
MDRRAPKRRSLDLAARTRRLIKDKQGVLTRDLLRTPGGFGLGQVPKRLTPDSTTTLVCGFCSTGCGLDVHLKQGEVINLSPTSDYGVNLGMACPKGWEALTPLRAPDRATQPMLRDGSGRLRPVDWPTALQVFVERMKGIQDQYGKSAIAFLSTGQITMEEMALIGALGQSRLRVLCRTKPPQIDKGVGHQLHSVVPTLQVLESQQQPLELVFPGKRPVHTIS